MEANFRIRSSKTNHRRKMSSLVYYLFRKLKIHWEQRIQTRSCHFHCPRYSVNPSQLSIERYAHYQHYDVHSFVSNFNPYSTVFIHWSPAIFSCLSLFCDDNLFIISLGRYPITPDHGGLSSSSSSRCRVLLSFPVAFYKSRRTELLNPLDRTMIARQGSYPTEGTTIHIFF